MKERSMNCQNSAYSGEQWATVHFNCSWGLSTTITMLTYKKMLNKFTQQNFLITLFKIFLQYTFIIIIKHILIHCRSKEWYFTVTPQNKTVQLILFLLWYSYIPIPTKGWLTTHLTFQRQGTGRERKWYGSNSCWQPTVLLWE